MDTGTVWHCTLVSSTPSQSIGLVLGYALFWCECIGALLTIFLIEFYFIMTSSIWISLRNLYGHSLLFELHARLIVTKWFYFCKCTTPWMFPPLDLLLEYWIGHVTFGLLSVKFTFPTRIFYKGVPGFATDCPCGVWCRGSTTCFLYVSPLFGNIVYNDTRFASLI